MRCVKKLGIIFLAVYLIINGVLTIAGVAPSEAGKNFMQILAIVSGVLILVSIGTYFGKLTSCDKH